MVHLYRELNLVSLFVNFGWYLVSCKQRTDRCGDVAFAGHRPYFACEPLIL